MQRFAVLLAAALWSLGASSQADATAVLDRLVARVDDKVILLSDVLERAGSQYNEATDRKRAMRESLDALIDQLLIAKDAERLNITVTDHELEVARQAVIESNHMTPETLAAELQKRGMTTSQFERSLREQVLLSKWMRPIITSKPHPENDAEFNAFFAKERDAAVQKLRASALIDVRL